MMMINVQDDYSTCINLMNRIWIQNLNKKKFIFFSFYIHSFISHSSFCDHGCIENYRNSKDNIVFGFFPYCFQQKKKKFLLYSFLFQYFFLHLLISILLNIDYCLLLLFSIIYRS